MMKVWVMQGSYEGEMFSSVHMTQKGCALSAISEVMDFLGIEDSDDAVNVTNDCYAYTETDGEQTEAPEWDFVKLKEMKSDQLWSIFNEWTELAWERMSDRNYYLEPARVEVQG